LKSIEEFLATFQKKMWSSDKPIVMCLDLIEQLLLEQVRMQTVMRESHKIISSLSDVGKYPDVKLDYLMNGLSGLEPAIFFEHLSEVQRQEYGQYLKKQVTFEDIQS
jgi:hypothetical protein